MKVAILQPCFIPWLGYFNIIKKVDLVIFLDNVQFDKRSWQQRNQIKSTSGSMYLTIPVLSKNKYYQKINEVKIDYSSNFKKKHLSSLEYNYKKTKYFDLYFPLVKEIYDNEYENLSEFNIKLISLFFEKVFFKEKKFTLASNLNFATTKSDLILDICKNFKASIYVSPLGSKSYLNEIEFQNNKIKIVYNNFDHPTYKQLHGNFLPNMSILDLIMNEGTKSWNVI